MNPTHADIIKQQVERFRNSFVIRSQAGTGILRYTEADAFEDFLTTAMHTVRTRQNIRVSSARRARYSPSASTLWPIFSAYYANMDPKTHTIRLYPQLVH